MVVFRSCYATIVAAWVLAGAAAPAQTFSVERLDNPALTLGNIVSAPSGDTIFRINPDTGEVTRISGTGSRMSASTARALVTIKCAKGGKTQLCNSESASVQIGAIGSSTGRAQPLTNLTVAAGTAVISAPKKPGNPLNFTVGPMGEGGTATFYVGADFPVAGDTSGRPTGPATTEFYVTVSKSDGSGASTGSGLVHATVRRPIALSATSNLNFGTVTRPSSGTGSVTIDAKTGARTVAGQGVQGLPSPTAGPARFTVTGEGGQVFSVTVPAEFQMKTSGGSITVTTSHDAGASRSLSGKAGTAGSATFNVGGSFPLTTTTKPGAYSGNFEVSVQYN